MSWQEFKYVWGFEERPHNPIVYEVNTEDEVIETAREVFKRLFTGKWKLVIESYSGDKDETIYLDEIP